MNLEDLNKSQLLLLTVLVNFVTSIAISVLTVSLLAQAPPTISQTVNRIVEHTVERVASSTPIDRIIPASAPQTVVIRDEDLLTAAIEASNKRSVVLYSATYGTSSPLISGTYLPKARAVVTASASLPKEVLIGFDDGTLLPASLSRSGATLSIYGFADDAKLPDAPTPNLLTKTSLKEGQTVLATGGNGRVVTGIVTKVDELVHTSLTSVQVGSAAVSSSGNIIGIAINSTGDFAAADRISTLLNATSTSIK